MRHSIITLAAASLVFGQLGCAGCLGFGDGDAGPRTNGAGTPPGATSDAGADGAFDVSALADGGETSDADRDLGVTAMDDLGSGIDTGQAGGPDTGTLDLGPVAVCGDGRTEGSEACDDGNASDGDYCAGDCLTIAGSCGDGMLQANEACDDALTTDCLGTHDGGDGSCVPLGSCSGGYVLTGGICSANATGLTVPCQHGTGFTLFRYHYSNNSTSAQIDVWDATCSYSFAPGSACNVYEICPGFCDPDVTSDGYPVFDTSDYMRARFNVNGLNFSQATLYVQARSYATSSSTNFRVWSPLYGETFGGPVDNDFVYDWYAVDWSNYLSPSDDPGYTAIQLYGSNGRVAVKAVELCVE